MNNILKSKSSNGELLLRGTHMQNLTSSGWILVKHEELSHPAYPIQLPTFRESVHHPTLVSDGKNVKLGIIVHHQWGKPDLLKGEDKKEK